MLKCDHCGKPAVHLRPIAVTLDGAKIIEAWCVICIDAVDNTH
jgi:hypothetical protein